MINPDIHSIINILWPGILNHLWQSTIFAAAAWIITLFLKNNRARIRYWVWFSVSIKFLIPFSIITGLGGLMVPDPGKVPDEISARLNVLHKINQPFNLSQLQDDLPELDIKYESFADIKKPVSEPVISETRSLPENIPFLILLLWLCGTLAVFLKWYRLRMYMSDMLKRSRPLTDVSVFELFSRIRKEKRMRGNVRLLVTHDSMEPGVFGIFRPVLLVPSGMLEHVNDAELETIFLHELEHIKYRDNLIAFIHMFAESLFWFHPVVWWTGSRLIFERELACDESVMGYGRNPRVYAEMLLKVCEYYFKSPVPYVSGVIGSSLKIRMEGIMKKQTGHKLGFIKKLVLSSAGLSVFCIPLLLGIINVPTGQAKPQTDDSAEYNIGKQDPDIDLSLFKPKVAEIKEDTLFTNYIEPSIEVESGIEVETGSLPPEITDKKEQNSGEISNEKNVIRSGILNKPELNKPIQIDSIADIHPRPDEITKDVIPQGSSESRILKSDISEKQILTQTISADKKPSESKARINKINDRHENSVIKIDGKWRGSFTSAIIFPAENASNFDMYSQFGTSLYTRPSSGTLSKLLSKLPPGQPDINSLTGFKPVMPTPFEVFPYPFRLYFPEPLKSDTRSFKKAVKGSGFPDTDTPAFDHIFEFKTDGRKLTGKVTILCCRKILAEFTIYNGRINKEKIFFSINNNLSPIKKIIRFSGNFIKDRLYIDQMVSRSGNIVTSNPLKFVASRAE